MTVTSITPDDLDFSLPESSIATRPASPRDSARMMVIRCGRDEVEHVHVLDLPDYLNADDLMVFNDTQVIPARLVGRRVDTGGRVEGLYVESIDGALCWRTMLKSNGRLRKGMIIELLDHRGDSSGFTFTLISKSEDSWIVHSETEPLPALIRLGRTPLPPYILRSREQRQEEAIADDKDRGWYQTVYADASHAGSVAAPTAGLHFTEDLLERVTAAGVRQTRIALHVGPGTFKPVTAATLADHPMHSEVIEVTSQAIEEVLAIRHRSGGRCIAVGTTTVRTLESLPAELGSIHFDSATSAFRGETDLLIAPPYIFKHVDGMLTNFHLPRSTLLALVAAKVGLERLKRLYVEAVDRGYRFYSYGDAMLVLP